MDNEQDDHEDVISLQPGQAETRDLDLDVQSIMSKHNELQAHQVDDRFLKYKTDSPSEETQQVLLDMFGEDACVKKSSSGTGVVLDKAQTDILNESWRINMPYRLTAYRDSYKSSFLVHEKSEEFHKVPSLDDIVEHFLIKRHSGKATFKRPRSLFTPHLKEMERLAFQGQSAARMAIVTSLYEQRALASLLQELRQDNPNWDAATQTVRDIFAMSSRILDQFGRTGAYDHFFRRKATILDMGVDSIKDVAKHADYLPLTCDGVLGKEFETKFKERKEKNKEFKDLVPEIKRDFDPLKRKSSYPTNAGDQKQSRFDNSRNSRKFTRNRSKYSLRCVTGITINQLMDLMVRNFKVIRRNG